MSTVRIALEWAVVLLLMLLAFLRKGKIRLLPAFFLTFFITFFTLFSPAGKILTTISSFKVTQDALLLGLHKSAVLTGMIFLSQTIVSYHIHLPGRAGEFLHLLFSYYEKLTSQRLSFTKGTIIQKIDEKLLSLWKH